MPIAFNLELVKNAMLCASGDQKSCDADSVPARGLASSQPSSVRKNDIL